MKQVIFLISAVMIMAGCTKTQNKSDFVYCSEGSPSIFNPQIAMDGATFTATRPIYNNLVGFAPGTTKVIPELAEKWDVSKDGLSFTFYLRKGVQFHKTKTFTPTRNFNAEDVLFSFNRQYKKDHPYHKINGGNYEYFVGMEMNEIIKEIVKVDDYTVKFVLSRKEAPFIANLGMEFAGIISKEYGSFLLKKGTPEKIDLDPVGTGPFIFKSYQKDHLIKYVANKDYYEGPAKIKRLVFAITQDPSVRFQKLKANECQFIAEPAPQDIKAIKLDKNLQKKIKTVEGSSLNVGYLAFNVKKKPLDNLNLRRAIHHALNRQAYIKAIYLGNAVVAKNPIPPTLWSYNDSVKDLKYDLKKAKTYFKKSGVKKGTTLELWTLPVSRPYNPNGKKMGELIQADLKKIGLNLKLVTYDWPTYLKKSREGLHDIIMMGWNGDNGDPDNFLGILLSCAGVKSGSNYANWCHKPFDELIQKGRQVFDIDQRSEIYQQAQIIFKTEIPWVTLAHAKAFRAMSKDVRGYTLSPLNIESFYEVYRK